MQPATDGAFTWGVDGSIVIYGLLCDAIILIPFIAFMIIEDTNGYAQYHQTYINMLFTAYAPLGLVWWIVALDDS